MKDIDIIEHFSKATESLLWLSESDYPFETIYIKNADDVKLKLLELANGDYKTSIKTKELDDFFSEVTEEKDWYKEKELVECKRYQSLVKLLKTYLSNIKIYLVGTCEIKVYILGTTQSGAIAGLSTISVET